MLRSLFGMIVFCLFTTLGSLSNMAQAQSELQSVTAEGVSHAETASAAAAEIQKKVTEDTAREQVIELIGEKRYTKSKVLVENRIVHQAVKFMPFVQPSNPVKLPDGSWKMSLELRISQASLRKMVLDAGLLSDTAGAASIVPLIGFNDRTRGVSVHWWMGEERDEAHKFLNQLSHDFYDRLQVEFTHQGFHMIRPMGMQASTLPEAFRAERIGVAELKSVSEYFNSPLAMRGDVRIKAAKEQNQSYTVTVRLQVLQTTANRTIGEISRSFDTDNGVLEAVVRNKLASETPEIAKDLVSQVLDAWQRGTMNANMVKMAVKGSLTPRQLTDFKQSFMKQIHEVKSLHERLFEPGEVVFEVDYSGAGTQLAEQMKSVQIPGFATSLVTNADQGLVVQVRSR
jgi:hypothetical protein